MLTDIIKEINKDPANEYKIIIINCSSGEVLPENYKEKGIASIALRSLNDIALTEVFNNDIEEFIKVNDILTQVHDINPNQPIYNFDYKTNTRSTKPLKRFSALIIQPDTNVLGDSLVAWALVLVLLQSVMLVRLVDLLCPHAGRPLQLMLREGLRVLREIDAIVALVGLRAIGEGDLAVRDRLLKGARCL